MIKHISVENLHASLNFFVWYSVSKFEILIMQGHVWFSFFDLYSFVRRQRTTVTPRGN